MPAIQFSGLASGIDSKAIIDTLMESAAVSKVPHQNKIAENKIEDEALAELNTKLLGLSGSLADFLTLSGGSVSKKAVSSDSNILTASVSNSANSGSLSVVVNNLAQAATLSFDDRYASTDALVAGGLTSDGTITFTVGQGADQKTYDIPVTSTTTVSELASKITEVGGERLQASVVNAGTASAPQYLLLVNGNETGLDKGQLNISVSQNIIDQGTLASNTLEQAENAQIFVSGIGNITRSSNTISDILPGLSFELKSESPVPVVLTVSQDADKTADKLAKIIESLNQVVTYSNANSAVTRNEAGKNVSNTYGSLAKIGVDESVVNQIRDALGAARGLDGSSVQIFADLGVTTQRDGTYKFDADKFKAALKSSPGSVEKLLTGFADTVGSTNGVVYEYTKFQGQIDIAKDANDEDDKRANEAIDRIQASIDKQREALTLMYANLESTIGKLNSGASQLLSALGSTSR